MLVSTKIERSGINEQWRGQRALWKTKDFKMGLDFVRQCPLGRFAVHQAYLFAGLNVTFPILAVHQ